MSATETIKYLTFSLMGFVIGALCVSYEINRYDYLIDLKPSYILVYDVSKSNANTLSFETDIQQYFITTQQ